MQNQLLYMPTRQYDFLPREVGLEYEDLWLKTKDGVSIHCWLVGTGSTVSGSPLIIQLHGNAGNISHRLHGAKSIINAVGDGCRVLLVGYRGYGQSEGNAHENGLKLDAQAALEHALLLQPAPTVFVLGQSLGGAVGIHLVANSGKELSTSSSKQGRDKPVDKPVVAGLILENTFSSIQDLVRAHYPLLWPLTFIDPLLWNKWKSIDAIDQVNAPILFLSGRKDEIVPSEQHDLLREKAKDCTLVPFGTGMYNDLSLHTDYYEHIRSFVHAKKAQWQ
jgi:pimeloyl-ACP methyl ester carboxylesterase